MEPTTKTAILLLVFLGVVSHLPTFINPSLLLNRGNDLQEVFWPVFYFIRENFWATGTIPLWNNLFFSGTPLLPDPQFSLFYPLNWLFIIFPTDLAFLVWIPTHTIAAGIFFYFFARYTFRYSFFTSVILGCLYATSARVAGSIEAGHYGLVGAMAWIPMVALSCSQIVKRGQLFWSILLGISLSSLFYLHTVTFILTLVSAGLFSLVLLIITKVSKIVVVLFLLLTGFIISLGLSAAALLPQIEWIPQTTRFLLLENRDVYPKWLSKSEFLTNSISPIFGGDISALETEKLISVGLVVSILGLFGFLWLHYKLKLLVGSVLIVVLLISLNNSSPFYNLLLSQDWYVLQRVSTRIWFLVIIISLILTGITLEKIRKHSVKAMFLLSLIAVYESLFIFYIVTTKPPKVEPQRFVHKDVYEFLKKDNERFRVLCVTRCLSQKQAALYGLELAEGYNTLQQTNYYKYSMHLVQAYWKNYTLVLPPFEIYHFQKLKPHAPTLADLNIKYVISPYQIESDGLLLESKINEHFIYRNSIVKNRVYLEDESKNQANFAKITKYSPNDIQVAVKSSEPNEIILAEVYSPGWKAYIKGKEEVAITEKWGLLRSVKVDAKTEYVDFRYEQDAQKKGFVITLIFASTIIYFSLVRKVNRPKKKIA